MTKRRIVYSDKLAPCRQRLGYAHAVRVGNTIHVAGQVARDREHNICHKRDYLGQIEMIFENMKNVLEAAGSSMQDVVKLNFFCRHLWYMTKIMPIFEKYFGDHVPAMTACEVIQLWHPHFLFEVEAIAVVGEEQIIIDGSEVPGLPKERFNMGPDKD